MVSVAVPMETPLTFTWVAAGKAGHVGVIYYWSPSNGEKDTADVSAATLRSRSGTP